jgi:DNA repair protein RadD
MSPGLYVQMAGRGMRPKSHTDHCLVLDFAGVVATHGPITNVQPPKKGGKGEGDAPVKICEECDELCHISAKECPACGAPFPVAPPKKLRLQQDDIMGIEGTDMEVTGWQWRVHTSKASGKEMLKVSYYGGLSDPKVDEYLPVLHEGYAGQKALGKLVELKDKSGAPNNDSGTLEGMVAAMNMGKAPSAIEFKKDGKFFRVIGREWR